MTSPFGKHRQQSMNFPAHMYQTEHPLRDALAVDPTVYLPAELTLGLTPTAQVAVARLCGELHRTRAELAEVREQQQELTSLKRFRSWAVTALLGVMVGSHVTGAERSTANIMTTLPLAAAFGFALNQPWMSDNLNSFLTSLF
eukprot:m.251637 g.251637  ORF g.251637 m.251637 type:complete len:143 (-) comp26695_c3_seq4:37-465(-)